MARKNFGGGLADWALSRDADTGAVSAEGGATVTFWNAESGGAQHIDLLDENGGAADHILTSDGLDGRAVSTIPPFRGPDGVWAMWASADGGPRQLMFSVDIGPVLGPLVDALNSTLTAHLGSPNPHGTNTVDLADWSTTAPVAGQVPRYEAGLWVPTTVLGLDPAGFVSAVGGSTILIPEGNTNTPALQIRLPSGTRVGAVNTMTVYWNSGSSGSPTWVETFRVGPRGELVLQPSAVDRVPAEIRQFSGGQTANLLNFASSTGTVLSFVDSTGRVRAPNVAVMPTWHIDTATVVTGVFRQYNPTGVALTLRGWTVAAGGNAPTGADLIIDPKLDGVALFTSGNRPRITAGSRFSGVVTAMTSTSWPAGSYLTVDVTQVGSTSAGTKITIQAVAY